MVALGLAIGLPCAIAAGRLIASRLYGLSAADPAAIAMAVVIIAGAAVMAGFVPARRASRIDPTVSLRAE
jgi:ABC-type antimicrobial peptide transport system permease subunit